jgi:2-polyprenyl-6-methoxyphenol hydroxylase-like FAD-dependent oxidoreductase
MTSLLLARAGVEVVLLEKHDDFIRDFRGDTVHASTIRLLDELGLGEAFRALPQTRLDDLTIPTDGAGGHVVLGEFGRLRPPYNYVSMVPQWDLLNLLVESAQAEPTFTLLRRTTATGLLVDGDGMAVGVHAEDETGSSIEIGADLVIACDGRRSVVRESSGLPERDYPVGFDTWWFRLPLPPEAAVETSLTPRFHERDVLLSFPRRNYEQVAFFARKGSDAGIRFDGLTRFRERIVSLEPRFANRITALTSLEDVHLLDVRMMRLRRWWRPGLLIIGDAAHAMSPVGGVGVNLAIQDAVAAATRLARPLLSGRRNLDRSLAAVQRRRQLPTIAVQAGQRFLHRRVFDAAMGGRLANGAPRIAVILARHVPVARYLYARAVAFGPAPEHAPAFARRAKRRRRRRDQSVSRDVRLG